MNKIKKFTVISKYASVRISIAQTEEFNRIYNAEVFILPDGEVRMKTKTRFKDGSYRTRTRNYDNVLHMIQHWEILERRVLIEKIGHLL